ncbi:DNA polymerase III subunit alpha [Virgibacillus halodenitrificans]|uniref:DNA polymerase III subunit alpha n=1 Tax=Virgibacillus halodenitrificans TaxID=1482 RepID=UPI0024BFF06D|nr:DNA polymerase III subunit alpha [Virgibacillus halodenitrificans]WHX27734.1 DNA polymerase III subunit alpha [Virgibacillus halodenitrificans]
MSYTHLQVRTGYSLMNSTITIDKLVNKANELQFNTLALTDENVLYGAVSFYKACVQKGIKPIIGMVTSILLEDGSLESCILLAKNNTGYHDLMKLSTFLQENKSSHITLDQLSHYTNELFGIIPAAQSQLTSLIKAEDPDINSYIHTRQAVFPDESFYIGIADHGTEDERIINYKLHHFYQIQPFPVVALQDVRYLNEKDEVAFDCLQAMKQGKEWDMRLSGPEVRQRYLKSPSEMLGLFQQTWPEAYKHNQQISDNCVVTFDFTKRMIPAYPLNVNENVHTYLEKECWNRLDRRYQTITKEITERLTYELQVIKSMKFSDYFLIVSDFIAYAKKNNILVGPGRGSAAGSLVAYVLGITDVDPIRFDLLFERFLNPERVTMPDIDIDFSDRRRDEVIDYVKEKYGEKHVAQIITFGTFAARSLIRELLKTLNIGQEDSNFVLKNLQGHKRINDIINESGELKAYVKQSEKLKVLFSIATKLEGIPRHISTHAAGIVISEEPLMEHIPLTVGANEGLLTQYPMNDLEAVGLLKIDLLGLRNLTLLEKMKETIYYSTRRRIDLEHLPEQDEKTFQLLKAGNTNGVFQFESQGMQQVLKRLKPTEFEDLVAVNALYRPGPMDYIPTYINRKHRMEETTYPHPDLAPILSKTYGVLVYQEQIMQIAHQIAGFTLGEADILRRAVSKKQQEVMGEQKEAFIKGCLSNGYDKTVAEEIFDWIVKFSNYGFNRSHAVAYSKISYQLAYFKAHFPAHFFAELLSSIAGQQEKIQQYIKEIKGLGLEVAPPSINHSFGKYSVEGNKVRIGLLSIKGIGNQVIREIIRIRKDGRFKNIFDFCMRVPLKIINRKILENLIMAGAFDETYENRASLLASIDQALEQGELFREFNDQPSLFQDKLELEANYVDIEDFSQFKKLTDEKELVGIYLSSHPLKSYRNKLQQGGFTTLLQAEQLVGRRNSKAGAVIQSMKVIRTKRGDSMAFLTLGDETGEMEAVMFPDLYRDVSRWIKEEQLVAITGKVENRSGRLQWVLGDMKPLDELELPDVDNRRLFIKLSPHNKEEGLVLIKKIARRYPGTTPVLVYLEHDRITYQLKDVAIHPTTECINEMTGHFGKTCVVLDNKSK